MALTTALVRIGSSSKALPVYRFRVSLKGYGSAGSAVFNASIKELKAAGLGRLPRLLRASQKSAQNPSPSLEVALFVAPGGHIVPEIFGGDLDFDEYALQRDECEITARDWAGRLIDSKVLLNQDEYTNISPLQLAQKLAADAGLTYDGPSPSSLAASDVLLEPIGHIERDFGVSTRQPKPVWNMLVGLARIAQKQVYVTADKKLVFRSIGLDPSGFPAKPYLAGWKWPPNISAKATALGLVLPGNPPVHPCMEPEISHQARRANTFQVIVMSYHAKTRQQVTATVTVVGGQIQVTKQKTIKAGIYKGVGTPTATSPLAEALNGKPVYVIRLQEATAAQVERQAEAVAQDIAKRLVTIRFTVDGDPSVSLAHNVYFLTAEEDGMLGFENLGPYSVVGIDHVFDAEGQGAGKASGFFTIITAQNVPPALTQVPPDYIAGT